MIYQFRCSCQESRRFQPEVSIGAHHTFADLHLALQNSLGFQPYHLASFIIPVPKKRARIEISELDPGTGNPLFFCMRNTLIGEMITPDRKLILYMFDLMNDRYLNLELTGTIMEKNLMEPVVSLNRGEKPVQVLDDVMTEDLFETSEKRKSKKSDSNYGVLTDYYEIFGEMEEYVL